MAYQIFWKIKFKSLRAGTDYTVNIWKEGTLPSGYPLTLKGGAQPFTTQEDDSDDMFTPVRTQTGYLRIVDDGKATDANGDEVAWNWKELLPETDTSNPVTLTDGSGTVVWQGYMQAQNFGGTLYGNPQEREFPVQCPLTALSASDVNSTNRELKNFAYIIKQAFDNLPCLSFSSFIFQGGTKARDMLMKIVDWQNLISEEDGVISGRYDNQQVLTDVCSFWGWTARVCGQSVYFTCADDSTVMPNALVLTHQQLNSLANGSSVGDTSETFLSNVSPSGDIFASTNNDDSMLRGYQKAVVSSDGNEADSTLMSAFPDSIEQEMEGLNIYGESYGSISVYYSQDLTSFDSPFLDGECESGRGSFNLMKIMSDGNESNYSVIRIKKSYQQGYIPAKMETTFQHNFAGNGTTRIRFGRTPSALELRGTVYVHGEKFEDFDDRSGVGRKKMYVCVGIGTESSKVWYNGTTWGPTKTPFTVTIGNQDDLIRPFYYTNGQGSLKVITGLIPFPASTESYGFVYVEILGSDDMPENNGQRSFEISNFAVNMLSDSTNKTAWGEKQRPKSVYKASNSRKMDQEFNADLIYSTSESTGIGYGNIINDIDHSFMTGYPYDGTNNEHPEQHLADRVVAWGNAAKRKIYAELRADLVSGITPRNTLTLDSPTGHVVSISHNWHDDILQLTTIEL